MIQQIERLPKSLQKSNHENKIKPYLKPKKYRGPAKYKYHAILKLIFFE